MILSRAFENRSVRLLLVFLMIVALALSVARPAYAVVGVTSILIPAVIAALESWGISTAADGLDGAEIAEWFHEKLTSWETAAGVVLENIAIGIKMTPLGQVLLNPVALAGIRAFGAWLVQQEGLVAGGASKDVITGETTFNGYPVYQSQKIVAGVNVVEASGVGCYFFCGRNGNYIELYAVSISSSAVAHRYWYNSSSGSIIADQDVSLMAHSSGIYWTSLYSTETYRFSSADPSVVSYSISDLLSSSGGVQSGDGTMSLVPSADMEVPTAADVQDKDMLLNTSLDVGADAASWYDGVMQKVAANDLSVTGTLTQAGTITADQVLDQGAIREEDGVVVWPDVVQPIGVTGLDDVFPFCIPFDIYHFCEALAAEPVAPSFDVPFQIEGIVDYTFHLDLADFDDVAALLRTLELLLFIVGLAYATRSKFIRG